ncbi:MAG: alpha-amylase family glycosyl hydrolase [Ilumatobacteraceae bacterium]
MSLPANPLVLEIFTWVWLHEVSGRAGRPVTLADVPAAEWDALTGPGIDAVWLMGVWERSPAGAEIARHHPAMAAAAAAALADVTDADVVGSAYCIRNYVVDARLGGDDGLVIARRELASRGVGLVLDFVPNHVAPDHPWASEHPERFVQGDADDLAADPDGFLAVGDAVVARGRDPYFPAWPEVLQLDASSATLRAAAAETVASIASRCDAIRCDMAMLMLDDIFVRTWGDRASGGPAPDGGRGYWPTVIGAVREDHPDVAFWAEAYWDLEPVLVEQGFDACYDKRLYDRLVDRQPASAVRAHLGADPAYQAHTLRFVENHDEPRLASVLPGPAARAAAVVALTLPGVALLHDGQAEGRVVRVPVTLARRPDEPVDADLHHWYDTLLAAIGRGMRRGAWSLLSIDGWPDNRSCERLVGWQWTGDTGRDVVVVNLSDERADGLVRLGFTPNGEGDGSVTFTDRLSGATFERDPAAIADGGLYVALDGYGVHVLHSPFDHTR